LGTTTFETLQDQGLGLAELEAENIRSHRSCPYMKNINGLQMGYIKSTSNFHP
jgi:hypothetical protein